MNMRKTTIIITAALLLLCGCAKIKTPGINEANKRYFDAWLSENHPELVGKQIFPGIYIIEDVPGTGEYIGPALISPYIRADYRLTDLKGNILSSSFESDARKLRSYFKSAYYGPYIFERIDNGMYAGIDYAISDMKVGGIREFIVPGWLMTVDRYDDENGYLENVSGTDCIYRMEITERIMDLIGWERDSVSRFIRRNYPGATQDTLGFYRKVIRPTAGDKVFSNDTTLYINYIGRRLDGKVFDTNIADTAKVHGIYSALNTYSPTLIKWSKNFNSITMGDGGNSVIPGFAILLSKMQPYEKTIGVFDSSYGYSSAGSGANIPSYSPLLFEVEIVDKE